MDEVDPLGGDDALKAAHVGRHDERVLGRRWKLDKEAANRVQFARQLAGVARDQRPRARLRERRGDGERGPFVAAGVDRRDDLEDRPSGQRRIGPAAERSERVDAHAPPLKQRERLTPGACSAKPASPRAS